MLYLRSWLEDYIDLSTLNDVEFSDLVSLKSGEVEEYKTIYDWFGGKILVGRIENVRAHPNADRLKIFEVNIGKNPSVISAVEGQDGNFRVQIVSAAPNVREGLIVPVATIGARLTHLTIAERKMRGETSLGMCCGKSELMLETEFSSGLWELESEFANFDREIILGQSICDALPEFFPTQTVYDIKYLPDKLGTLGNHLGFALELAICLEDLSLLKPVATRLLNNNTFWQDFQAKFIDLDFGNRSGTFKDDTGYTNAFMLFDLDVNPSGQEGFEYTLPHIYQQRLFFTEVNLIGGLADLSNYLLFDVGQPSHFFADRKSSESFNWEVKKLENSQNFVGLGRLKDAQLPSGVEVITEADKIIWIPGISGADSSKVLPEDSKISIEIANFEKSRVAQSSFKINYRSDSARLWNSGVNIPVMLVWLLHLVESLNYAQTPFKLNLILYWFSNLHPLGREVNQKENFLEYAKSLLDIKDYRGIHLDLKYIAGRMDGNSLEHNLAIIEQKLNILGEYKDAVFYPNIFYSHVESQEEVLFEILELHGFDNLEDEYLIQDSSQTNSVNFDNLIELKKAFVEFGFQEVITRPLSNVESLQSTIEKTPRTSLEAISSQRQDENFLRESLFSSLLKCILNNINQGQKQPKIFENSKLYKQDKNGLIETLVIEAIATTSEPSEVTSLVNYISKKIDSKNPEIQKIESSLGQGFDYDVDKLKIQLLEISNKIKKSFELPLNKKFWYLKVDYTNWDYKLNSYKQYYDESDYPTIKRSYSLAVNKDLTWQKVATICLENEIANTITRLNPTERITKNDQEVLNFEVEFVSYSRNLVATEITDWENQVLDKLQKVYAGARWC
jgi:phenylalanyl-tRNA synthetase beta chain